MDYAAAIDEALKAVNAQGAQQQIAANIGAGSNAYNNIMEQQSTARSLEKQRLAQRMADIGIGGPSPLTLQNNAMMAENQNIGNISNANQNYADMQNAMIAQANANAAAQGASITGQMNTAQNESNIEDISNTFERDYRLYLARKITASQFKKKHGIDVRGWAAKKEVPKPWFDDIVVPSLRNAADNAWFNDTVNYVNNQVNSKQMTENEAVKYFEDSMQRYGLK